VEPVFPVYVIDPTDPWYFCAYLSGNLGSGRRLQGGWWPDPTKIDLAYQARWENDLNTTGLLAKMKLGRVLYGVRMYLALPDDAKRLWTPFYYVDPVKICRIDELPEETPELSRHARGRLIDSARLLGIGGGDELILCRDGQWRVCQDDYEVITLAEPQTTEDAPPSDQAATAPSSDDA